MQVFTENLSPEVSSRRSKSDPALTPKQCPRPRVGTPYPKPPQKVTIPASKIPRLTTPHSQTLDLGRSSCHKYLRPKLPPSTLVRTDLFPSQNLPSTTTLHYPREILYSASPQGSYTDVCKLNQPPASPPLLPIYRRNNHLRKPPFSTNFSKYGQQQQQAQLKQYYHQQQPPSADYQLLTCKDFEKSVNHTKVEHTNISSTNISNKIRSVRNSGAILDSEGYIQGPHTAHNKRIESYKRPNFDADKTQSHIVSVDQDRGDFYNNNCIGNSNNSTNSKGLPPLPPKAKSKNIQEFGQSIPRIATATLSQGNTVFEPYSSAHLNNNSYSPRPNSRSVPHTPIYNSGYLPVNDKINFHSPRKLNFSTTSLQTKVHEAESCTNLLLRKKYSEPQFTSNKCPLCAESKGQCHLHHRTMCSRYMTDLEWRICHAVNIYVYKNGEEGQTPVLVHIPPSKKKNMKSVMTVIQERICYPIGYAKYLYRMNGKKVINPGELEMYNNYVVASNYDKCFKCVCYARRKSPLLVLAKESKHVRELRLKNYQYELYLAKKRCSDGERQSINFNESGYPDGYIPGQIPIGFPVSQISANLRSCGGPACTIRNCYCKKKPKYTTECIPATQQSSRNSIIASGQLDYTVNTYTISTAPLKDPADCTKKRNKGSDESIPSFRYRGLMNDEESLFYSSKKKKLNRGVLDTSGESKKIFYQETGTPNPSVSGSDPLSLEGSGTNANMAKCDSQSVAKNQVNETTTAKEDTANSCKLMSHTTAQLESTHTQKHFTKNCNQKDSTEESLTQTRNGNVFDISKCNNRTIENDGKGDEEPQKENMQKYHSQTDPEHPMRFEKFGRVGDQQRNIEMANSSNHQLYDRIESVHIIDESVYQNKNYLLRQPSRTAITYPKETDGNALISAPSKSYTVLAKELNEGEGGYTKQSQETSKVSPRDPSPSLTELAGASQPRTRNPLQDLNNNTINCGSIKRISEPLVQYQKQQDLPPNANRGSMYTVSGASPVYMSGNQTQYTCFGSSIPQSTNGFFLQSTPTTHTKLAPHQQSQIQQMYPVEILNQRPSYGPLMVDSSNLSCFGYGTRENSLSLGNNSNNCYYNDEIDIPYTASVPPVAYQASGLTVEPVGMGSYVQVPSYVSMNTSPIMGQQFSYRHDLQGYTSPNRSMGLVAIKKPSRRNVAIQMGEPSSSSVESRSPSQVTNTTDNDMPQPGVGSPRLQQPFFYQSPSYCYNVESESGNTNQQFNQTQNHQQSSGNQLNDHSVLPPPTRYRDGLLENRSCRSYPKQNYPLRNHSFGGANRKDESLCKENCEFYGHVHESKHPRYVWKKS